MAKGTLSADEKQVLRLIGSGHDTLCNVVDFMGWIVPEAMLVLDRLEILGYIKRVGSSYNEYLRFSLTDKGFQVIEELPERERELIYKYGISEEDYTVLKAAYELGPKQNHSGNLGSRTGFRGMQIVACVENLEKKGYVRQVGLWRRYLVVTPQGEKVLQAS